MAAGIEADGDGGGALHDPLRVRGEGCAHADAVRNCAVSINQREAANIAGSLRSPVLIAGWREAFTSRKNQRCLAVNLKRSSRQAPKSVPEKNLERRLRDGAADDGGKRSGLHEDGGELDVAFIGEVLQSGEAVGVGFRGGAKGFLRDQVAKRQRGICGAVGARAAAFHQAPQARRRADARCGAGAPIPMQVAYIHGPVGDGRRVDQFDDDLRKAATGGEEIPARAGWKQRRDVHAGAVVIDAHRCAADNRE